MTDSMTGNSNARQDDNIQCTMTSSPDVTLRHDVSFRVIVSLIYLAKMLIGLECKRCLLVQQCNYRFMRLPKVTQIRSDASYLFMLVEVTISE
jgi:hypothetical protein